MTYLRLVDAQRTVVRANPRRVHNQNIRKSLQETTGDFSFVRVTIGDSSFLCQVMAIVVVENKHGEHHNFFVVQQMEECTTRQNSLPFNQFKYPEYIQENLHVVESANIHPACVLSIVLSIQSKIFAEIPVNRITKNLPVSYEQLQEFNNEKNSYCTFEDEQRINDSTIFKYQRKKHV
jgi:hypothetical protein